TRKSSDVWSTHPATGEHVDQPLEPQAFVPSNILAPIVKKYCECKNVLRRLRQYRRGTIPRDQGSLRRVNRRDEHTNCQYGCRSTCGSCHFTLPRFRVAPNRRCQCTNDKN